MEILVNFELSSSELNCLTKILSQSTSTKHIYICYFKESKIGKYSQNSETAPLRPLLQGNVNMSPYTGWTRTART